MSDRQARRQADRYKEAIMQAHDRLHKDDVDACHELLHTAMDANLELPDDVAPMSHIEDFDRGFRALCVGYNRRASYVALEGENRLMSGGDAQLVGIVDGALRGSDDTS